jgi:hypothetical protein
MVTNVILAAAALLAPTHWTSVPLGTGGELRYEVDSKTTHPGYGRTLRLVVFDRGSGKSRRYATQSSGYSPPTVQVFRFRGELHYSVLILSPANRMDIDLLRVNGTKLSLRWSDAAYAVELVRDFPGGPTIFAQIGNDEYGLIRDGTLHTQAYEVWKPVKGVMCCRRLAIRVGSSRFKLLPRNWGESEMKATGVWYGPSPSEWP